MYIFTSFVRNYRESGATQNFEHFETKRSSAMETRDGDAHTHRHINAERNRDRKRETSDRSVQSDCDQRAFKFTTRLSFSFDRIASNIANAFCLCLCICYPRHRHHYRHRH